MVLTLVLECSPLLGAFSDAILLKAIGTFLSYHIGGSKFLCFTTLKDQVKDNWEHFITSLDLNLETQSIFNCCLVLNRFSHLQLCVPPIDCSPARIFQPRILQTILEWVSVSFLQRIFFPTESNLGLLCLPALAGGLLQAPPGEPIFVTKPLYKRSINTGVLASLVEPCKVDLASELMKGVILPGEELG